MNFFKKTKYLFLICLLILMVSASVAVASLDIITAGQPLPQPKVVKDRPLYVGVLFVNLTSESSQRNWIQLQIEAEHRAWKLETILDADSTDRRRDGIENFLNLGVDAIIINNTPMEEIKDLVIEARKEGVGVYNIDTELRDGIIVNSTQPNGVVGVKMFYYGLNRLRNKGKMIMYDMTEHILRRRCFAVEGLVKNDWPSLAYDHLPYAERYKAGFDYTANYIIKYGNEIDWIFAGWDTIGITATRAVEQAGFTKDDIFVTGIDGGKQAFGEIRKGSPFVATMTQPFELYTHTTCEVVNQVQVEGVGIGEEGSMVPVSRIIYLEPTATDITNLPPIGASIHEIFASTYYDPNKKDAWYFWGEPYRITE